MIFVWLSLVIYPLSIPFTLLSRKCRNASQSRLWMLIIDELPKLGKIQYFVRLKISFVILYPMKQKINYPEIHIWAGPGSCLLFFFLMLAEYILCFSGICEVLEAQDTCMMTVSQGWPCLSLCWHCCVELWHLCRAYSGCLTGLLCGAGVI